MRRAFCSSLSRPSLLAYRALSWSIEAGVRLCVAFWLQWPPFGHSSVLRYAAFRSAYRLLLFHNDVELMAFEILHRSFMRLGFLQCLERAQVAAFARLYILVARVQTIFARFQFTNHDRIYNKLGWRRTQFRWPMLYSTAAFRPRFPSFCVNPAVRFRTWLFQKRPANQTFA
jgi:hypothetical protein